MASKMCTKCQVVKSVNDFNKMTSSPDGYMYKCKSCNAESKQEWINNNREHYNECKRNLTINNKSPTKN